MRAAVHAAFLMRPSVIVALDLGTAVLDAEVLVEQRAMRTLSFVLNLLE